MEKQNNYIEDKFNASLMYIIKIVLSLLLNILNVF